MIILFSALQIRVWSEHVKLHSSGSFCGHLFHFLLFCFARSFVRSFVHFCVRPFVPCRLDFFLFGSSLFCFSLSSSLPSFLSFLSNFFDSSFLLVQAFVFSCLFSFLFPFFSSSSSIALLIFLYPSCFLRFRFFLLPPPTSLFLWWFLLQRTISLSASYFFTSTLYWIFGLE